MTSSHSEEIPRLLSLYRLRHLLDFLFILIDLCSNDLLKGFRFPQCVLDACEILLTGEFARVFPELPMRVVETALHHCFPGRTVSALHLPGRPEAAHFCEAMLHAFFQTYLLKDMDGCVLAIPPAIGESDAVACRDRVNQTGNSGDQAAQIL